MQEEVKKRVLVLDDDKEFVNSLTEKFSTSGLEVVSMVNGREALDYIRDNTVDFMILDFIMPEMDGYTFYHIVTHDMKKDIPTIVLTNLPGDPKDSGLEVFVKNQTDLGLLVSKIKQYLTVKPPTT